MSVCVSVCFLLLGTSLLYIIGCASLPEENALVSYNGPGQVSNCMGDHMGRVNHLGRPIGETRPTQSGQPSVCTVYAYCSAVIL